VIQQGLSTLDFDYVDYAERHLQRCRRSAEDPSYAAWLREATAR
jgi:hypothetical protein